jgi:hypothetical protein
VQYRGDADAGAEMPGVGGDGEHRLCRGREQEPVDPLTRTCPGNLDRPNNLFDRNGCYRSG